MMNEKCVLGGWCLQAGVMQFRMHLRTPRAREHIVCERLGALGVTHGSRRMVYLRIEFVGHCGGDGVNWRA